MARKRRLGILSSTAIDFVELNPPTTAGLAALRLPRFEEVALADDPASGPSGDPGETELATHLLRDSLWNASSKEMERLASPGSRWVQPYHPADLVFVPRDECEVRLWTIAYPHRREVGSPTSSAPRSRLRLPDLGDGRKWRRMTLGEFHRQRKFFGLQQVGGRIVCIRTMSPHQMVRIPLSALRVTAPLFSRMLELPWFTRSHPTGAGGGASGPGHRPRSHRSAQDLAAKDPVGRSFPRAT